MRKIRKFAVGGNAILLTAEQMRQIGGGAQKCNTGACEAFLYWYDGTVDTVSGTCASKPVGNSLFCYCSTPEGNYGQDVREKNDCIAK